MPPKGWRKYAAVAFTMSDPNIEPCPTTGCWLWTGSVRSNGYGRDSQGKQAHRAAWESLVGPIPRGMYLDHICRNVACVNPDHLRVVTPRENTIYNSRSLPARNHAKPNCPRCGTAFVVSANGSRQCVPCAAARSARRTKEARARMQELQRARRQRRRQTEPEYAARERERRRSRTTQEAERRALLRTSEGA